jgi:hypothetical protein
MERINVYSINCSWHYQFIFLYAPENLPLYAEDKIIEASFKLVIPACMHYRDMCYTAVDMKEHGLLLMLEEPQHFIWKDNSWKL